MRIYTSYYDGSNEGIGWHTEIGDMFPTRDDAIADAMKRFELYDEIKYVSVWAEEITNTGRRTICQVFSKEKEVQQ